MFGLTDDELNAVLEIVKHNNIQTCVLFGSRAMGNYKKGSDVVNLEQLANQNLMAHIRRAGKPLYGQFK